MCTLETTFWQNPKENKTPSQASTCGKISFLRVQSGRPLLLNWLSSPKRSPAVEIALLLSPDRSPRGSQPLPQVPASIDWSLRLRSPSHEQTANTTSRVDVSQQEPILIVSTRSTVDVHRSPLLFFNSIRNHGTLPTRNTFVVSGNNHTTKTPHLLRNLDQHYHYSQHPPLPF